MRQSDSWGSSSDRGSEVVDGEWVIRWVRCREEGLAGSLTASIGLLLFDIRWFLHFVVLADFRSEQRKSKIPTFGT